MKKYFILVGLFTLLAGAHTAFAADTTTNFVSLTNIPAITDVATTSSLPTFLNALYKICIGAAATIAVFQIMYAGVMWMSAGDNAENVSKARGRISAAVFGLILILTPYIVFSIINPRILNLDLNFGAVAPQGTSVSNSTVSSTNQCTATSGYAIRKLTVVPGGGSCNSVYSGSGWSVVPTSCCSGTATDGEVCCQQALTSTANTSSNTFNASTTGPIDTRFIDNTP